jgi:hypothetical protein
LILLLVLDLLLLRLNIVRLATDILFIVSQIIRLSCELGRLIIVASTFILLNLSWNHGFVILIWNLKFSKHCCSLSRLLTFVKVLLIWIVSFMRSKFYTQSLINMIKTYLIELICDPFISHYIAIVIANFAAANSYYCSCLRWHIF